MNEQDDLYVAQHEAAHVVVGAALGLSLYEAVVGPSKLARGVRGLGYAWFFAGKNDRQAYALMLAAGVAWDVACGLTPARSGESDWHLLRKMAFRTNDIRTLVRAAAAILADRSGVHAQVTRALLAERRITGREVLRIARGQRVKSV